MLYEPAGYERNYFRRRAPSEEEREDPEVMAEFFRDADINFPHYTQSETIDGGDVSNLVGTESSRAGALIIGHESLMFHMPQLTPNGRPVDYRRGVVLLPCRESRIHGRASSGARHSNETTTERGSISPIVCRVRGGCGDRRGSAAR